MSRDPFDFTGKVALVTGGGRGLGFAMSRALAERGADLVLASRKLDILEEAAASIRAMGRRVETIACHVGRWSEIDVLVERAYAAFERVDILINNAGMSPVLDSSVAAPEAFVDAVLALNFKGPYRLSALVGDRMKAAGHGSIINISSMGALRPHYSYAPYAGAKAALNALTFAQAIEFGPEVRVNAIVPGSFRTGVAEHWPAEREAQTTAIAGRYGKPEEIVTAMLYLASDQSTFTTGSLIRVDGGRP
jgi:NAD(P)-dependent dehydrogenase (short-subunit alcohol dehydrogenase family)